MSDETEYFTLVFEGNLREFKGNPFRTETPFGIPRAGSLGDANEKVDKLRAVIEECARIAETRDPTTDLGDHIARAIRSLKDD